MSEASTYTPTTQTLVGVPAIDSRGRVTLMKWLDPLKQYHAHRFEDGSVLLAAVK